VSGPFRGTGSSGSPAPFKDHFSRRAVDYARSRPHYPRLLFSALAQLAPGRGTAWDCGTGNGQAATGLAEHFTAVVATDASADQIAHGETHSRVTYRVTRETASGLPDHSVDIVTAAQAAHWFDLPAFYQEALRVLRPGGVLAIWCYGLCRVTPEVDTRLARFYRVTVGPYWPADRAHVDADYRTLSFPLPELSFPTAVMEHAWTLADFVGFLGTWSAVAKYRSVHGIDPVEQFESELEPAWGGRDVVRMVRWPLAGRLGRTPGVG